MITDFGAALLSSSVPSTSRTGHTGTKEFLAPEAMPGEDGSYKKYDMRCDIWSTGIILYFMAYKF